MKRKRRKRLRCVRSRLSRCHSPSSPVVLALIKFRTFVNEVTPPNFCRAHSTSSSSAVGKSCLWMLECGSPKKVTLELFLTCKEEARLHQSAALSSYSSDIGAVFLLQYQKCLPVSGFPLTPHPTLPPFSELGSIKEKCLLWLSIHESSCTTLLEPQSFLCFLSGARKWDLF